MRFYKRSRKSYDSDSGLFSNFRFLKLCNMQTDYKKILIFYNFRGRNLKLQNIKIFL